jgi:hypothetical protein
MKRDVYIFRVLASTSGHLHIGYLSRRLGLSLRIYLLDLISNPEYVPTCGKLWESKGGMVIGIGYSYGAYGALKRSSDRFERRTDLEQF